MLTIWLRIHSEGAGQPDWPRKIWGGDGFLQKRQHSIRQRPRCVSTTHQVSNHITLWSEHRLPWKIAATDVSGRENSFL